jgi:hypothetical protein
MEITLMLKGSASQIAMVLANLPDGVATTRSPVPVAVPVPAMPINGGGDDDDAGPVNAAAPATDASGLPWDERIHAKTKATTEAGMWRKRRGVDEATVSAVEAQLRATLAPPIPAPVAQPVAMPIPPMQPMTPPPLPVAPAATALPVDGATTAFNPPPIPVPVAQPVAMPVPPMPVPEPAPPPPPAAPTGALDFAQFMQHLSGQMTKRDGAGAPLVHADYLASITNEISTAFAPQGVAPLTAITDIATNPAMITYATQLMQRDGRW